VAANHQNGLVDPMLLLSIMPRRLIPISKAPLFRHPLIAPFLWLAGAVPVERRQDPGSDPWKNVTAFRTVISALGEGDAILIFPEGKSQAEPTLMPLHTGAARMLLEARVSVPNADDVVLLPVGLVYDEPGQFRVGHAFISVGSPVSTQDLIIRYRTDPDGAVRQLTARLADALRQQIVEAGDRETLRLVEFMEDVWRAEKSESQEIENRIEWIRQATRAYRYLRERFPRDVESYRRDVAQYAKDLELAGLTARQVSQSYPSAVVWRYALREGCSLLLGLPLALLGIVSHAIPYGLTALAARGLHPESDTEATYKIAAGVIFYPLCWTVEAWATWRILGGPLCAVFVSLLVPAGFFALTWRHRFRRLWTETRAFVQFLMKRDLRQHLTRRRHELVAELAWLTARVPESVRRGQSIDRGAERG